MKDHERRTREAIKKVCMREECLPAYFKEQSQYYRRKRLVNDLTLAADVIQMLQDKIRDLEYDLRCARSKDFARSIGAIY